MLSVTFTVKLRWTVRYSPPAAGAVTNHLHAPHMLQRTRTHQHVLRQTSRRDATRPTARRRSCTRRLPRQCCTGRRTADSSPGSATLCPCCKELRSASRCNETSRRDSASSRAACNPPRGRTSHRWRSSSQTSQTGARRHCTVDCCSLHKTL
jgi:hypothetical protein